MAKIIWLVNFKKTLKKPAQLLMDNKIKTYYKKSIIGMWCYMRAKYIVSTHTSPEYSSYFGSPKTNIMI